jgi:transposase
MLALTPATRIFVAVAPVDLRRGFDGLCAHVQSVLAQQVVEGGLFVFTNRRCNRLRLVWFDGTGLWLATKRLEAGSLSWPRAEGVSVSLRPEQLSALMTGLGETTGRSRADRHRTLRVPVKELYVRPLRPDFREVLCR